MLFLGLLVSNSMAPRSHPEMIIRMKRDAGNAGHVQLQRSSTKSMVEFGHVTGLAAEIIQPIQSRDELRLTFRIFKTRYSSESGMYL